MKLNILNNNNSIRFGCFKCLDTNKVYKVMSTRSTFDLKQPHYKDRALQSEDIIERDDGMRRTLMRIQLKDRFTNIEEYKQKPR